MRTFFPILLALIFSALVAEAITIGQGPILTNSLGSTTDKKGVTWYEEFQDWTHADLRALDVNGDPHLFGDDNRNTARDLIAFYTHDDGTNVYFRADFFDLGFQHEEGGVDVYVAIDCAPGGNVDGWLPDFTDTRWDQQWDVCVGVYDSVNYAVYDAAYAAHPGAFLGSYWRADLDAVEFGITRSFLVDQGWDGSSPFDMVVFTARDGTQSGAGNINSFASDVVDTIEPAITLERGNSTSNGWLRGSIASDASAGRAKYAVIAHANQSVSTKGNTQGHIFTDYSPTIKPGFIRLLDSAEMFNVPVNLHISGSLLMSFLWANQDPDAPGFPDRDGPTFLRRVDQFVKDGPGSLVGGVLAEHIMPYFEGEVNRKSIEQNSELIEEIFGLTEADMKVMHTPERVIHTNTNSPHVDPAGPLKGRVFEDIEQSGFEATYLDEVTHLHWWFYPNEQTNWVNSCECGLWAGGQGCNEEPYHHKIHKINGVYCFMINDREDQTKFGNGPDGGMAHDTRFTLLDKAMQGDYAQITLVFDDWEAFAGNSFASATPNNNADQFHQTLRWAANHPWIEIVNLKDVLDWALADPNWVIDHGYVYDKSSQTYEWLKRASEHDYDHWYYGSGLEESFFARTALVHNAWAPAGMKIYGDMNTPGTLIRDSWDAIQQIASTNLKRLAEWSYSAMIYETAWHDEDANPDQYQSRNYQVTFNRNDSCTTSYEDTTYDPIAGWALRLHGHVRDMGVLRDASAWVDDIKLGIQGPETIAYSMDIDDDTLDEYVLCNNKVYLCFERWGARLIKAFVYDPLLNGGDAREVIGVPVANPSEETENEGVDQTRCSALKDRYCSGWTNRFIDLDFGFPTAPAAGPDSWTFVSEDGRITKTVRLENGRDVMRAEYRMAPDVGQMFTRYGVGPNQMDLMLRGPTNLVEWGDLSYRGLENKNGGEVYVVAGRNMGFITGVVENAGWEYREIPLTHQYETYSTDTNWTVALAFSRASARDLDGDGLLNTNEMALGTNHEKADTDDDGMPDGYEVAENLQPTVADAFGDDDGDLSPNIAEFVADTRASDSNSFFVAQAISRMSPVRIVFEASTNRVYSLQFNDWLGLNTWSNVSGQAGVHYSTPGRQVLEDDSEADTRAYRIQVELP